MIGYISDPMLETVPPLAAPFSLKYPQFQRVRGPEDVETTNSWLGFIQPFADDNTARFVLRQIEARKQLLIADGRIKGGKVLSCHWADPLLVEMGLQCQVLICEQIDAVPRVYLLSPRYLEHYNNTMIHPHPRGDQMITIGGYDIPGLCVFSSAEFEIADGPLFNDDFMDQVSQYIANHLIWMKTRRLLRIVFGKMSVLRQPAPGQDIDDVPPQRHVIYTDAGPASVVDFWSGYWPGRPALATTPLQHLLQLGDKSRCYCGRAKLYRECCKAKDMMLLSPTEAKTYELHLLKSQQAKSH